MRRALPRKLVAWISLFAYVVSGAIVGAHELVLCVGPSGHLAIEIVDRGPCSGCGAQASGATAAANLTSPFDADCLCVDVPILSGSLGPQTKPSSDRSHRVVAAPAVFVAVTIDTRDAQRSRLVPATTRPVPDPSLLRTVVLLV